MGVRLPFLFNMPAWAAWPLAFITGIALLLGLVLVFSGTPYDRSVFVAALFGPVAFVPLIARWKRMSLTRWTVGVVIMALVQIALLIIVLHPITVLLAVLFHHPPRPKAAPAPSEPVAEPEEAQQQPDGDIAPRPVDLPALNRPHRPGAQRPRRRRRRW